MSEADIQEFATRSQMSATQREALLELRFLAERHGCLDFWEIVDRRSDAERDTLPIQTSSPAFEALQRRVAEEFARTVAGKSVALVGPAVHVSGQGMGEAIDRHDLVVRLNYHWPTAAQAADLGGRTDLLYHCCNGDYPIQRAFVPEFAGLRFVLAELGAQSRMMFRHAEAAGIQVLAISESRDALKGAMDASPTTGALAMHHLLSLDVARLDVFGMSFLRTGYAPSALARGAEGHLAPHHHERELAFLRGRWFDDPRLAFDRVAAKLLKARSSDS